MRKGCPHKDIRFCPLYHAMHEAGAPSCDDGELHQDDCAVARKTSYAKLVAELRVALPGLVEQLLWQERLQERKEQQARNMRLLGLH